MMKGLACKDVGSDCSFEARGRTTEEVLKKVAAHAKSDHGFKRVTKSDLESWRKKIHNI